MFRSRAEYWFTVRYKQALAVNPGKLIGINPMTKIYGGCCRRNKFGNRRSSHRRTPAVLTRGGGTILGVAEDARTQDGIGTKILATHKVVGVSRGVHPDLIDSMIGEVATAALATNDGIVIAPIAAIPFILTAPTAASLPAARSGGLRAADRQ
jgi:hypothetical protein